MNDSFYKRFVITAALSNTSVFNAACVCEFYPIEEPSSTEKDF